MTARTDIKKPGRPSDTYISEYVQKILALRIDASVFVQDATRDQLEFLRKPVKEAGAKIEIVQVAQDDTYGVSGVRIFRRAGEYDEL